MAYEFTASDFDGLNALSEDEVVTHSYVRDVTLPSGKTLALVTVDNGRDHTRPNTFGPAGLLELASVLDEQKARAGKGEIHGLAVVGKPFILAAGADLSKVSDIPSRAFAKQMAELGHWTFDKLRSTVSFVEPSRMWSRRPTAGCSRSPWIRSFGVPALCT